MKQMKTILGTFLVAVLLVVSRAEAATVQYMLDQSNTLADNIDYLLVTISDDQSGQLDFLVETQPALNEMSGENFGIASFGFNLGEGIELSNDDFLVPEKWKVQFNKGMSEAGMFDVRLLGTGQTRQDPLQFSVLGLELGDIIPGFASHVAGFKEGTDLCFKENSEMCNKEDGHISSAFFYGDRLVSAVPVPAAIWLLGSGMLLLGGIAIRRRA
jgi:hypothetical protein